MGCSLSREVRSAFYVFSGLHSPAGTQDSPGRFLPLETLCSTYEINGATMVGEHVPTRVHMRTIQ